MIQLQPSPQPHPAGFSPGHPDLPAPLGLALTLDVTSSEGPLTTPDKALRMLTPVGVKSVNGHNQNVLHPYTHTQEEENRV